MTESNDFEMSKQLQEMEQGAATLADMYPPMWYRMYSNLVEEGFSKVESMDILKTYISANCQPA